MARERAKEGILERTAGFMKRLNYALGGVAIAGAVAFESATLAAIGVLQFAEGAVWKWLKERRSKKAQPRLQMAT